MAPLGGAGAQDLKSAFFSLSLSSREKGTTPVSPTAASSELVNAVILLSSIMALPAAGVIHTTVLTTGCHTQRNKNKNKTKTKNKNKNKNTNTNTNNESARASVRIAF